MKVSHKHLHQDANGSATIWATLVRHYYLIYQRGKEAMPPLPVCVHTYRHIMDAINKDYSIERTEWCRVGVRVKVLVGVRNSLFWRRNMWHQWYSRLNWGQLWSFSMPILSAASNGKQLYLFLPSSRNLVYEIYSHMIIWGRECPEELYLTLPLEKEQGKWSKGLPGSTWG